MEIFCPNKKPDVDYETYKVFDFSGFLPRLKKGSEISFSNVKVNGLHPIEKLGNDVRVYKVEKGSGVFYSKIPAGEDEYLARKGDIVVIGKGEQYRYQGVMRLLEINFDT